MKKDEAKAYIEAELKKGTSKGEILTTLLATDKIGNTKPTEEFIANLIESVELQKPDSESVQVAPHPAAPPQKVAKGGANYEKWRVTTTKDKDGIVTHEKIKKEKDVLISDEQAARLNAANLSADSKGYSIHYFKK
jgi:hypothetical protein